MASKRQPRKSSAKKRAPANTRRAAPPAAGKRVDTDAAVKWYRERRPLYESLAEKVAAILEEVLESEGIEYHSVDKRAKEPGSFESKAQSYDDPTTEMHDLAGIRVIAYVESEVKRIAAIVGDLFEVDPALSEDKSLSLGVDKVGYRSDHYVATLPAARCKLPEFRRYAGMRFEVQVRTILQHAWAEIEHDRSYKFAGVLPPEIQRRFALLAGSLELLDREFDGIAGEIDDYAGEVAEKTSAGQLDIPVDTISLRQYLLNRFASAVEAGDLKPAFGPDDSEGETIVEEIHEFGLSTLGELDKLIRADFISRAPRIYSQGSNFLGLVRDILIIADAPRYFEKSWDERWGFDPEEDLAMWAEFGVDVDAVEKYRRRK